MKFPGVNTSKKLFVLVDFLFKNDYASLVPLEKHYLVDGLQRFLELFNQIQESVKAVVCDHEKATRWKKVTLKIPKIN